MVVDQAVGCSRDQEPAVGKRRPQAGAEPVIGQRKRLGQAVVERNVIFGPVAHADARRPCPAAVPRVLRTNPSHFPSSHCRWVACQLCDGTSGCWTVASQVMRWDRLPVGPGLDTSGCAAGPIGKPSPRPGQHAEIIVVGVVLHHQHDDVLDLRQQVAAGGLAAPGAARAARRRPSGAPGASAHGVRAAPTRSRRPSPEASRYRLTPDRSAARPAEDRRLLVHGPGFWVA